MTNILQLLQIYSVKVAYSAFLTIIVVICATETLRLWFDRSLVLQIFQYSKDGTQLPAQGDAFTQKIANDQRYLRHLLTLKDKPYSVLTEQSSLELAVAHLNIATLDTSYLSEVRVEMKGINVIALFVRFRDWIRQSNAIRGKVDHIDDTYYVFAEWENTKGQDIETQIYNKVHTQISDASFEIAARLLLHEFSQVKSPSKLTTSLLNDFDPERFVDLMEAWRVYDWSRQESLRNRDILKSAINKLTRLIETRRDFPHIYKLLANLHLQYKPLEAMNEDEKGRVRDLLGQYVLRMNQIGLEDPFVTEQLASLDARIVRAAANRVQKATAGIQKKLRKDVQRPDVLVFAGSAISPKGSGVQASLCCIVANEHGIKFGVTADYLFSQQELQPENEIEVVVPGFGDDADVVVGHYYGSYHLDDRGEGIALFRLSDNVLGTNEIAEGPPIKALADDYKVGELLTIFGRTSHGATGTIVSVKENIIRANQLTKPGDGGAPVINESGELVGLGYARVSGGYSNILRLNSLFAKATVKLLRE